MRNREVLEELIRRESEEIRILEAEGQRNHYGKLYVKKKGNNIFYAEYIDGKQIWISKDKERVYKVARHNYVKNQLSYKKQIKSVLEDARKKIDKIDAAGRTEELMHQWSLLNEERIMRSPTEIKWTKDYTANQYKIEMLQYSTFKGVKMRSKSERVIGNALEENNVLYRYEPLLIIEGNDFYPDFLIRRRDGKLVLWEHFGLMDREEYRARANYKINQYRKAGFRQFDNLICTQESDLKTMDVLKKIIDRFVLDSPKSF